MIELFKKNVKHFWIFYTKLQHCVNKCETYGFVEFGIRSWFCLQPKDVSIHHYNLRVFARVLIDLQRAAKSRNFLVSILKRKITASMLVHIVNVVFFFKAVRKKSGKKEQMYVYFPQYYYVTLCDL